MPCSITIAVGDIIISTHAKHRMHTGSTPRRSDTCTTTCSESVRPHVPGVRMRSIRTSDIVCVSTSATVSTMPRCNKKSEASRRPVDMKLHTSVIAHAVREGRGNVYCGAISENGFFTAHHESEARRYGTARIRHRSCGQTKQRQRLLRSNL